MDGWMDGWMDGCMCVCVSVCVCLCMYVCMYLSIYLCMYLCIYVSMYLCIYVSMYLCIYVSMYLCIYVSMYLCIYVSMYLYTYVHERHCRGVSFFRVSGPSRCRGRTTHLSTSRCTPNHIWSQCWCSKPPGPGSTWVTAQYFCNGAALLTEKSSVQQCFSSDSLDVQLRNPVFIRAMVQTCYMIYMDIICHGIWGLWSSNRIFHFHFHIAQKVSTLLPCIVPPCERN